MIVTPENKQLLNEITTEIISKHPLMAKKYRKDVENLGKYYHDIHSEYHKGLYVFGIYQTLFVENPEKEVTEEEYNYLVKQLDKKEPCFIRMITQSIFSESILSFRRITDEDDQAISIPNLHRKLKYIITVSQTPEANNFMCELEKINKQLKCEVNKTIKNYADLRIAHLDKRWETKMSNKSVTELKKGIFLIKDYLNTFKRYYTGSTYCYFSEQPDACVNDQAKRGTERLFHLIYGNKKYNMLKNKLKDFREEIESYEIPSHTKEVMKNKILEILFETKSM